MALGAWLFRLLALRRGGGTTLSTVHIVTVVGENRVFWSALHHALAAERDFRIRSVESRPEADQLVGAGRPCVLIVESSVVRGDAVGQSVWYADLMERHPELVILEIDSTSADLVVRMRDAGLATLVSLVREAANRDTGHGGSAKADRLVGPTEVQRRLLTGDADTMPVIAASESSSEPVSPFSRASETSDGWAVAATRWLDVCFALRAAREPKPTDATAARVWGVSFGRVFELLGVESGGRSISVLERELARLGPSVFGDKAEPSRLARLFTAFGLSASERRAFLIVLSPELNARYGRVLGILNDDASRQRATASVLGDLLGDDSDAWSVRKMLASDQKLGAFGIVVEDDSETAPAADRALRVPSELVEFLRRGSERDGGYGIGLRVSGPAGAATEPPKDEAEILARLRLAWQEAGTRPIVKAPVAQLIGPRDDCLWLQDRLRTLGTGVCVLDLGTGETTGSEGLRERCMAAVRIARLYGVPLIAGGADDLAIPKASAIAAETLGARAHHLVLHGFGSGLLSTSRPVLVIERPTGSRTDRAADWLRAAEARGVQLERAMAERLASTVRLDKAQIDAALRSCGTDTPREDELLAATRQVVRTDVPRAVRLASSGFTWQDIVLQEELRDELRRIPDHVRLSGKVLDDWGMRRRLPYGDGVAALFSGASGTGKTMAAQVIANDLGAELFQVDLAKTISKYIGETEQRLDEVFDAAERVGAVLLFDEADALFGKRSEVKDAHDRYANIEVAYLLQRMEQYSGLTVLTTNMRQNMDRAFLRRLRFILEFPFPGAKERRRIWDRVFAGGAPRADDIDFDFLARRLNLTGGHIQQIAVNAAFMAAGDPEADAIAMAHVARAACVELRKLGMRSDEATLAAIAA